LFFIYRFFIIIMGRRGKRKKAQDRSVSPPQSERELKERGKEGKKKNPPTPATMSSSYPLLIGMREEKKKEKKNTAESLYRHRPGKKRRTLAVIICQPFSFALEKKGRKKRKGQEADTCPKGKKKKNGSLGGVLSSNLN